MTATTAMVQAKVVKGGGAGASADLSCSEIKAKFGIDSGAYKDLDVEVGEQREHGGAPASAFFESGRGNAGDVARPGCGGYDHDNAWCWVVEDGQSHFTEHRFLTDRMSEFQNANGGGTLQQSLDAYQKAAEDCLHQGNRAPELKDPERRDLAKLAAACMRAEQEACFASEGCNVPQSTPLRPSLPLRSVRPPRPTR